MLKPFSYQTFLGNDQYGSSEYGSRVHVNVLEPPIHRLVALRILPKTWHNRICLRLEVLGCNAVQVNSVENNPGNLFWPIIMTKNQLYMTFLLNVRHFCYISSHLLRPG